MTRRLLLTYLTITAVVLVTLEVPLGIIFARNERERLAVDLERDAVVMASLVEDSLEHGTAGDFTPLVDRYVDRTGARVVIVDADGVSIADNEAAVGRSFASRPEIAAALDGRRETGQRYSVTLGEELFYVAVPVASGGNVYGAVRISFPTSEVEGRIRRTWLGLAALGLVVLACVAVVGALLARSVTRPVRELEEASRRLASGDLGSRAATDSGPREIRSLSKSFDDMADQIEELIASQRAFVADASHQLRTPLTALRLRLENMEATEEVGADEYEAAVAEVERLGVLVDQVLRLTAAERPHQALDEVDISDVLRVRCDAWEAIAAARGVGLETDLGRDEKVAVVHGALEQMVDNLLDNAIRFSPAGSAVRVRVEPDGRWTYIHVEDEGPGMSEAEAHRAFDRFWRANRSEKTGTGLGLAIVRELARAGGGDASLGRGAGGGVDAVLRLVTVAPR
ncbi:MAG: HAMP domain-containing protein [Acidimicrobiia bacterium]|nr:HAMP domain-containing protein [Acidimicrobiia bacterium]